MRTLSIALAVVLVGCAYAPPPNAPTLVLSGHKLRAVVEDRSYENRPGVTTEINRFAVVADLKQWESDWPAGPMRDAILAHEDQHAEDEANEAFFYFWYDLSAGARWRAEKRGYRVEILMLAKAGITFQPESLANVLSGELYGYMVSYDEALSWVRGVISEGH